jgi:hypothetical protein
MMVFIYFENFEQTGHVCGWPIAVVLPRHDCVTTYCNCVGASNTVSINLAYLLSDHDGQKQPWYLHLLYTTWFAEIVLFFCCQIFEAVCSDRPWTFDPPTATRKCHCYFTFQMHYWIKLPCLQYLQILLVAILSAVRDPIADKVDWKVTVISQKCE